jgi:YesN/AraC family two-component response regulator
MADFKVLFVDDEKNILKSFVRMFFNDPIKIYTAEGAKEALNLISSTDLDLVVTDIKMPGMHGLELIEEIRKKNSVIPIMVYSAFPGMKEDFIVHTQNIEAYYTKPDDYDLLCKKIKDMASEKIIVA